MKNIKISLKRLILIFFSRNIKLQLIHIKKELKKGSYYSTIQQFNYLTNQRRFNESTTYTIMKLYATSTIRNVHSQHNQLKIDVFLFQNQQLTDYY